MAKEKKCECEAGAPAWVVTFGDLMSLLMTFFVLLLSFSTMEKPKELEEAVIAIRGAFGVMPENLTMVQINPMPVRMKRLPKEAKETARELAEEIQIAGQSENVKLQFDDTGALKIDLPEEVLFEPGQATLKQESFLFLSGLSEILAEIPDVFFDVQGHSDNTPVGTNSPFVDNHHLSFARADQVMRYLSRYGDIPIDRFEVGAAGSGKPLVSNTTEAGRQANRRVEISVKGLLSDEEVEELKSRVGQLTS